MGDLSTTITGLKLKNPTMLASGILGETGESLLTIAKAGAGALVTKSVGPEQREGHKNPTFIETEHGILNAMGLPNPGIDDFRDEVNVALESKIPVIGSIFGKDAEEFAELATKMEVYGVHAVELNLSCPHVKALGAELGHDPKIVTDITKAVKGAVNIPVFVKLSPNVKSIAELARAVEEAKGDAVVVINTVKAMAINADLAMPVLSNTIGGLSGPAIKPVGLRCVYEIRTQTDLPIIGVGGIINGTDAVEYIMAGATCVQIGSGIYYKGKGIFEDVCREMQNFMDNHRYNTVKEMVGIAAKR
jgi:dihydroorotate dehydrogenase (NAD+) catalytic subunit